MSLYSQSPIIYIDESGFAHDMPRAHGSALKGQRCYGTQTWGSPKVYKCYGCFAGKDTAVRMFAQLQCRQRSLSYLGEATTPTHRPPKLCHCDEQRYIS